MRNDLNAIFKRYNFSSGGLIDVFESESAHYITICIGRKYGSIIGYSKHVPTIFGYTKS